MKILLMILIVVSGSCCSMELASQMVFKPDLGLVRARTDGVHEDSCLLRSKTVKRLRGQWENEVLLFTFDRDSFTEYNKIKNTKVRAGYGLEQADGETRFVLLLSQHWPEQALYVTVGIPFALLRYKDGCLLMKTVNRTGIPIKDYDIFPWPEFVGPWKTLRRPPKE